MSRNGFAVIAEWRSWLSPRSFLWLVLFGIPAIAASCAFAVVFLLFLAIVAPPAYFQYVIALPASEDAVGPPQWMLTLFLLLFLGFVGSAIGAVAAVVAWVATTLLMAAVAGSVTALIAGVRRFQKRQVCPRRDG